MRQIADRPVWVELSLYAGVIGGAGYDYLAYTSYLRDKQWGNAAPAARFAGFEAGESQDSLIERPALDGQTLKHWIRAPLIDCTIELKTTDGNSWYRALILELRREFRSGLSLQSSYTWSRSEDTTQASTFFSDSTNGTTVAFPEIDRDYNKGPSDWDTPHNWVFNVVWDVPFARGTTGRDKLLFCGYHGWHDWYQAANLSADENLNAHLFPGIEPIGVPKALAGRRVRRSVFIIRTAWSGRTPAAHRIRRAAGL